MCPTLLMLVLVQPRYVDYAFYGSPASASEVGDVGEVLLLREDGRGPAVPLLKGAAFVGMRRAPLNGGYRSRVLLLEVTPEQARQLDLVVQADAGWVLDFRATRRAKPPKNPPWYH
jgi:hypothetical protein